MDCKAANGTRTSFRCDVATKALASMITTFLSGNTTSINTARSHISRLYQALNRVTLVQRRPALDPLDSHPSETLPEPRKATYVSNKAKPESAVGTEKVFEVEERGDTTDAGVVTAHVLPSSRLVAWTSPDSLGAEKFRALATRLMHLRKQRELSSLQVTSSVIDEGKSLVAANLAVTLAKYLHFKTLLLEGDLHRPMLASLFGLSELPGLGQWWSRRDQDLTHFLLRFSGLPLWFLAAGEAQDQPSEVLNSVRFEESFTELTSRFEWIVVDSTPMLPIVDVNLWSRLVNGTLLVVREGVTPIKELKKGLQALDNPKLVGVVLNDDSGSDRLHYGPRYYIAPIRNARSGKPT